jgi:hypothetical protein
MSEAAATHAKAVLDSYTSAPTAAAVYADTDVFPAQALAAAAAAHAVDHSEATPTAASVSADSTTLVGTGVTVQAVLEELDNGIADHLADTVAAHAATAISADSTTLVGVGTTVQAVFEELDDAIAAVTPGPILARRLTFTETAGAGTYAASAVLAAGAAIHQVSWETTAAWDADTATIDLGYTGTLTAYGNDLDVDGVAEATVFLAAAASVPDYFAGGTTFTATLTAVGTGGTTGRTIVWVCYSIPPAATAATKS